MALVELSQFFTILSVLLDRGHKVALLTDGRMSGASGKVPAAIHVSPEALAGGLIAKLQDGDLIRVDAPAGKAEVPVASGALPDLVLTEGVAERAPAAPDLSANAHGVGREMFEIFRQAAGSASDGARILL